MDSIVEKSSDRSRGLLFGLLTNCIFSSGAIEDCPLWELRSSLSIEQKHEFVMGLSDEKVASILAQHDKCYEKRLADIRIDNPIRF